MKWSLRAGGGKKKIAQGRMAENEKFLNRPSWGGFVFYQQ
jgi:hypothetical protein